jgi:hypothetical protein
MLSVGVKAPAPLRRRDHRSYFVWVYGKPPDVIIEFVSDRHGGEEYYKAENYALMGVPYYVIYDPEQKLKHGVLRSFELRDSVYCPLDRPWFANVGLGLMLWKGTYEGHNEEWLRWCDREGKVISTGQELAQEQKGLAVQQTAIADQQKALVEQERLHRERLEAHLRSLGIDPTTLP